MTASEQQRALLVKRVAERLSENDDLSGFYDWDDGNIGPNSEAIVAKVLDILDHDDDRCEEWGVAVERDERRGDAGSWTAAVYGGYDTEQEAIEEADTWASLGSGFRNARSVRRQVTPWLDEAGKPAAQGKVPDGG